jgi:hypothetical protein
MALVCTTKHCQCSCSQTLVQPFECTLPPRRWWLAYHRLITRYRKKTDASNHLRYVNGRQRTSTMSPPPLLMTRLNYSCALSRLSAYSFCQPYDTFTQLVHKCYACHAHLFTLAMVDNCIVWQIYMAPTPQGVLGGRVIYSYNEASIMTTHIRITLMQYRPIHG